MSLFDDLPERGAEMSSRLVVSHPLSPDETPTEIVLEGIRQGLHEALTGETIPLSEMWKGIDAE